MNLLEEIPEQIFQDILLRVPYTSQSKIKQLLKPAKDVMEHIRFYQDRMKYGLTKQYICLLFYDKFNARLCLCDPVDQSCKRLVNIPKLSYFLKILNVKHKIVVYEAEYTRIQSFQIYDLLADTWKYSAEIPIKRPFGCCVSPDGLIYITGSTEAAIYNVEEDKWELLPQMHQDMSMSWCVFIKGLLYVISRFFGRRQRFDPNTKTWTTILNMPSPNNSSDVINAFGELIGFGNSVIEQYDWERHEWRQLENIVFDTIVCATVWCDRIFLCGYYGRNQKFLMYKPEAALHENLIFINFDEEVYVASMATIEI